MSGPGVQIAQDKVDRYRSMGAFGKPVYQSHVQLRAMLLAQRLPRLANYFARPIHDPDQGELRWVAELPGSARSARALSPEEREQRGDAMASLHADMQALVERLRAQGGEQPGGAAAFASVLEHARRVPAQGDLLHFVGDQPVIAFWGFEDAQAGSIDPAAQWPAWCAAALTPPAAAAPPDAPVLPVAAATSAGGVRRWGWLGLLALLLLALLLAWLFGLLPGRGAVPAPAASNELQIPPGALERGDLAFLEGPWQLGAGHLSAYADDPTQSIGTDRHVLRFDGSGGGSSQAVERKRGGRPVPDCGGDLRARTDGKKLYFERGNCVIPGRPGVEVLNGSRHECEIAADGSTMCYGVNPDGVRWDAPLKRIP